MCGGPTHRATSRHSTPRHAASWRATIDAHRDWYVRRMLLASALYYTKVPLSSTFKWNPTAAIKDHYDLVTNLNRMKGKDFLLLTYKEQPIDILARFNTNKPLAMMHFKTLDGRELNLYLYILNNFNGYTQSN